MDTFWTRLDAFEITKNDFVSIWSLDRLDRLDTFFRHSQIFFECKETKKTYKKSGVIRKTLQTCPTCPNVSNASTATGAR